MVLSGESKVDKSLGITFHHYIKVINQKNGKKEIKKLKNKKKKKHQKFTYNMWNVQLCSVLNNIFDPNPFKLC
jgi:hypothetical protein